MTSIRNYKEIPIKSIGKYPKNSRTHSEDQINQVISSIKEFGFTNPLLIDENHMIIAGHCRLEAAVRIGLETVPCIILDALSDDQKRAYIIADNKIALNAGWDFDILRHEIGLLRESNFKIGMTGFLDSELCEIFPDEIVEAFCDENECPDIHVDPVTKVGDVWLLGEHRLMCGDSTIIDSIDKLMNGIKSDMVFTDPPYNTGMTSKSQKGSGALWKGNKNSGKARLSHMFDDSYTDDEWQEFMSSFMASYWFLMKDNSVAYICLDWRRNHELIPHIESSGFHRSNIIVWDKVVHGLGSDYKYTYELINVCKKGKPKLKTHQGEREYSDVWHIQRIMGKNDDHATAKPIELIERSIRHGSIKGDVITDLFGGSGSTLIACEKTKRKCYMMELDPKYCDVIIKRYENFSGNMAILEE